MANGFDYYSLMMKEDAEQEYLDLKEDTQYVKDEAERMQREYSEKQESTSMWGSIGSIIGTLAAAYFTAGSSLLVQSAASFAGAGLGYYAGAGAADYFYGDVEGLEGWEDKVDKSDYFWAREGSKELIESIEDIEEAGDQAELDIEKMYANQALMSGFKGGLSTFAFGGNPYNKWFGGDTPASIVGEAGASVSYDPNLAYPEFTTVADSPVLYDAIGEGAYTWSHGFVPDFKVPTEIVEGG
tara:strand:- start:1494 stop:2216 length:723 start_codon:yes stop_codon:yes gene_type:complete